jgi:hypothetical protein
MSLTRISGNSWTNTMPKVSNIWLKIPEIILYLPPELFTLPTGKNA